MKTIVFFSVCFLGLDPQKFIAENKSAPYRVDVILNTDIQASYNVDKEPLLRKQTIKIRPLVTATRVQIVSLYSEYVALCEVIVFGGKNLFHLWLYNIKNYFAKGDAVAQSVVRRSRVRSPLWPPATYWLGRCQYNVTG